MNKQIVLKPHFCSSMGHKEKAWEGRFSLWEPYGRMMNWPDIKHRWSVAQKPCVPERPRGCGYLCGLHNARFQDGITGPQPKKQNLQTQKIQNWTFPGVNYNILWQVFLTQPKLDGDRKP